MNCPGMVKAAGSLTDLIEKAKPILQAAMPAEPSEPFHSLQPVTTEDRPPESQKA